jgi:hypothetical protein
MVSARLPVNVLSDFVGAGPTTLLHQAPTQREVLRMAVIVKDLGAVHIDGVAGQPAKGGADLLARRIHSHARAGALRLGGHAERPLAGGWYGRAQKHRRPHEAA